MLLTVRHAQQSSGSLKDGRHRRSRQLYRRTVRTRTLFALKNLPLDYYLFLLPNAAAGCCLLLLVMLMLLLIAAVAVQVHLDHLLAGT